MGFTFPLEIHQEELAIRNSGQNYPLAMESPSFIGKSTNYCLYGPFSIAMAMFTRGALGISVNLAKKRCDRHLMNKNLNVIPGICLNVLQGMIFTLPVLQILPLECRDSAACLELVKEYQAAIKQSSCSALKFEDWMKLKENSTATTAQPANDKKQKNRRQNCGNVIGLTDVTILGYF